MLNKKKLITIIGVIVLTVSIFLVLRITVGLGLSREEKVKRLFEQAKYYHLQNQLDEAIKTYKNLLSVYPEHEEAQIMLGVIYVKQNKLKEAENKFKAVLVKNPDNFRAHGFLGVLYARLGKYEQALKHCRRDLQVDPKSTVRLDVARIYFTQGKLQEAEKELLIHIKNWPDDSQAYLSLARLFAKENKIDEAVLNYEKSFKLDAHSLAYRTILEAGKLYEEQNDYQKAVNLYKKILKTFSTRPLVEALKNAEQKLEEQGVVPTP